MKLTVLVPCVEPKFTPMIVMDIPTVPEVVDKLEMIGDDDTVNSIPLLPAPPTVTTTFPDVAVLGTGTSILLGVQFVGAAVVPLKVTVLVPCVDPKFSPKMVTKAVGTAIFGDKVAM